MFNTAPAPYRVGALKITDTMTDDFTIFDFGQKRGKSNLDANEATIKDDGHNRTLYFNKHIRDAVVPAGCTFLRVRKDNLLGCLHLIFSREGLAYSDRKMQQLCYCNKQLVELLFKELNLQPKPKGTQRLKLGENISTSPDFFVYSITALEECESGSQGLGKAGSGLFG